MSSIGWTIKQEQAITIRNANVLVSAAAGAGKTAVLVERLISRITASTDPVGVDRILVVTFTNAAAQEMKERIGLALTARQQADPGNSYLERQLLLLNKASISTLHSFCLDVIRQNYYRLELPQGLNLDPGFRVGDEIETTLLKLDVLEEVFEEKYTMEEPLFLQLVECFGGQKDDQSLQNLITKLYDFSRSQREPEVWLAEAADTFRSDGETTRTDVYFAYLTESVTGRLEDALSWLQEATRIAALPGGPNVYVNGLREEIIGLQEIISLRKKGWEGIFYALQEFHFSSLKPCRGEVDLDLKEQAQTARNEAKKIIENVRREYLAREPADMVADMHELAPLMGYLCNLVTEYAFSYLTAKLTKNIIDFNDIEHLALNLLSRGEAGNRLPSALAEKIQEHYIEVLIDEYQDINGVQEAILGMVTRQNWERPNMFMVGDVKQSIYGFRLANPGLFLGKYLHYDLDLKARETKIMLAENFRSRKMILTGVNFIFRQLMTERMGGLVYDEKAELVCGATYPPLLGQVNQGLEEFPIEVHLLDRQPVAQGEQIILQGEDTEAEEASREEELDVLQVEARVAGQRIQELLGTCVWDKSKGEYRPASYRDMVVLLRTTKGSAEVFLEEFRRLGIPSYADVGGGYLAAQEIRLMLALLQIIDNPRQDLPLVAVLRSNLVGFSSSQLAAIRLGRARGDFYDALRLAARKEEGELGVKSRQFLSQLQAWRTYARRHALTDLLWLLYRETGYYTFVGALPGGKQRQANLTALQDRARQYEQTALRGLFKFLRFLDKLEDRNGDLGVARALGEKEDVVRIMSIHKSKGLEFPIVFVAGLGKKFNLLDLRDDVLVDRELGLGPVWADPKQRIKYPTLARIAVKDKLKRDTLAEESRILYVAMTRAKEALILLGTMRNLERKLARWKTVMQHQEWDLPTGLANGAGCFLDWLGPALFRHQDGLVLRQNSPGGADDSELIGKLWFADNSRWHIRLGDSYCPPFKDEIKGSKYANELDKISRVEALEAFDNFAELIEQKLTWVYPGCKLVSIPAKLSVSEIKNHYRKNTRDPASSEARSHFREYNRRPRFLQAQQGLAATEKGSALHQVMWHLDLQRVNSVEEIETQLEEMVGQERLSHLQRQVIDPWIIRHFFQQPLGCRLLASNSVRREVPFTIALRPQELYPEVGDDFTEKIILQGTLDCLFQEGDALILVDYKTDLITADSIELFKARYQVQLDLYAQAVETILKKPVQEKILYSFHLGQAITL